MIAAFIVAAQVVAGVQQGGPPRDAPRAPVQTGTAVIRGGYGPSVAPRERQRQRT